MSFPTTESPISQIIEQLDSLPNSARDAAVNNSIVLSENLDDFGESVLKLYNESGPSAREAIAEMFELVCNEPFEHLCDSRCPRFGRMGRLQRGRTQSRISGNRAGNRSYRLRSRTQHRPARQGYGLHRRLDVCNPRTRLQLGSGRGGAHRRGMPGRSLC